MDKNIFDYLKDLDEDIISSKQLINFIKTVEIKQLTFTGNEKAFNFMLNQQRLNLLLEQINKLLTANTKKYQKQFDYVFNKETINKAKKIRKHLLGFVINSNNDNKEDVSTQSE